MESIVHDIQIFQSDQLSNENVKAWQQEMMNMSNGKFEIVQICLSGSSPILAVHYKTIIEQKKESTRRASQSNGTPDVYTIGGGLRIPNRK